MNTWSTRLMLLTCFVAALPLACAGEDYKWGEDSAYHEGVPKGKVEKQPAWTSTIFPGTVRDWWIYVPAQYDGNTPAALMVFQDGGGPVNEKSEMRAPVVFDNLIHKKEMPVTIGLFVNPGVLPPSEPGELEGGKKKAARQNRSFEYDSLGDRYARFLIEELIPEVAKKYKISADPNLHALCGQSSGGSCAFTAAWERPDYFRKVVSGIGSFTSIHGANAYPDFIRKMEPKPIRIYMQDGDHDLDIYAGSWWHASMDMAAAFRWSGYDYNFLQGKEGHSGRQLGANFPDAMRWIWRAEAGGERPKGVDPRGVFEVLVKDEGWKKVCDAEHALDVVADAKGTIYFWQLTDFKHMDIRRIEGQRATKIGEVNFVQSDFPDDQPIFQSTANGLLLTGPGGQTLLRGTDPVFQSKDLVPFERIAVNSRGDCYYAYRDHLYCARQFGIGKQSTGLAQLMDRFIFTPDQGFLIQYDETSFQLRSFRVEKDASLTNEEPFYSLLSLEGQNRSGATAAVFDDKGRLYVSSINGIQIFDQGGRVMGILTLPENHAVNGMAFGGANFDTLYVTTDKAVYARKLNARGVRSCDPPVVPPPPRM